MRLLYFNDLYQSVVGKNSGTTKTLETEIEACGFNSINTRLVRDKEGVHPNKNVRRCHLMDWTIPGKGGCHDWNPKYPTTTPLSTPLLRFTPFFPPFHPPSPNEPPLTHRCRISTKLYTTLPLRLHTCLFSSSVFSLKCLAIIRRNPLSLSQGLNISKRALQVFNRGDPPFFFLISPVPPEGSQE